ncbi:hypothetical protein M0804_003917 [Polistes exclamans]|nr:hypothetical protein M0804_003917 [Polistes exclamans]
MFANTGLAGLPMLDPSSCCSLGMLVKRDITSSDTSILIKEKYHNNNNNNKQNTVIFNYTDVQLPNEVEEIINLEPGFGIPIKPKEVQVNTLIKDLEYGIKNITIENGDEKIIKDTQNNVRTKAVNIITNYLKKNNLNIHNNRINSNFRKTKQFLKQNPEIIVTRSDKGNNTVIMKKDEYLKEMEKLLEDKNTYSLLNKDPTNKFEKMANNLITKLQNELIITEAMGKNLRSYNTVSPKLYGLRKTHKKECNMRPVVSSIGSPCYKIAKFLHLLLTRTISSKFVFSIKNSFEFAEFIRGTKLPEGYILVSLDVISLFTNIPKELVIKIIEDNWDELSKYITVHKKTLIELIQFCFESSYFRFNGVFYQQLDGSSMGNPASPVLANIVMNYILKKVEGKLPFQVPFLKVYVDDIVTAIPKDRIEVTIKTFNSVNKKIQFTIEVENNKTLPFLDLKIIRKEDGSILTDWYIKPTSSGRCLNFKSNHPISQKIGVVKGLLFRALTLSSKEFHNNNKEKIEIILKKQQLSNKINKCFKNTNVKLVFYNLVKIKSIYTKLKDKDDKLEQSNLVYKIPCECEKCYVGQTKQKLKKRLDQHRNDSKPTNAQKTNTTALAEHHFKTGHIFKFDETKILDKEDNWKHKPRGTSSVRKVMVG